MFMRKNEKDEDEVDAEVAEEKESPKIPDSEGNNDEHDMIVDGDALNKPNLERHLKTLDHEFLSKKLQSDNQALSYHSQHDNIDVSSYNREGNLRGEESSMPSILAPRSAKNDYRNEIRQFEKSLINRKPMMFSDLHDTAKFMKEELKEEVEEEKELHHLRNKSNIFSGSLHNPNMLDRNFQENDEESSKNSDGHHRSRSCSDEEINNEQENQDRDNDMIIDDRTTPRNIQDRIVQRENSFQTRAELHSTVENLSNTIPNIPISNEYPQNHNTVNDRRLFTHLIGSGSIESSDYEDGDGERMRSSNVLEEQIESIKISFVHTITQERQQIQDVKKELRKHKSEFDKRKKQEWDRIQMEKEILKENKRRISKLLKDSEDIIDLDIGGTHQITTTKATL
jgi:hypothetical protein